MPRTYREALGRVVKVKLCSGPLATVPRRLLRDGSCRVAVTVVAAAVVVEEVCE